MSEHSTPEERTEMPTDRRMTQLRQDGSIPMSQDISVVLVLIAGFMMLYLTWTWFMEHMQAIMRISFEMITRRDTLTILELRDGLLQTLFVIAPEFAVLFGGVGITAVLASGLQTKFNIKGKIIDVKWSHLNPISGIKKVFSAQGFMTTGKALLKLALILPIGYFSLKKFAPDMVQLMHLDVEQIMAFIGVAIYDLFWKIMYVLIVLAIIDYFWQQYQWLRQNKMTKDEVKDERRSLEGDEETKRKIQQKGLSRIMQRINESVPQADVIITNPTHYSIALKYDRETMAAPIVLAKGKGYLALKIREIARESGIPILERKPLARALYATAEIGTEIPYELFRAVAEVLAYVYRLKKPHAHRAQQGL